MHYRFGGKGYTEIRMDLAGGWGCSQAGSYGYNPVIIMDEVFVKPSSFRVHTFWLLALFRERNRAED